MTDDIVSALASPGATRMGFIDYRKPLLSPPQSNGLDLTGQKSALHVQPLLDGSPGDPVWGTDIPMGSYQNVSFYGTLGGDVDTNIAGDAGGYMGLGSGWTYTQYQMTAEYDGEQPFYTQLQAAIDSNNLSSAYQIDYNNAAYLVNNVSTPNTNVGVGYEALGSGVAYGVLAAAACTGAAYNIYEGTPGSLTNALWSAGTCISMASKAYADFTSQPAQAALQDLWTTTLVTLANHYPGGGSAVPALSTLKTELSTTGAKPHIAYIGNFQPDTGVLASISHHSSLMSKIS